MKTATMKMLYLKKKIDISKLFKEYSRPMLYIKTIEEGVLYIYRMSFGLRSLISVILQCTYVYLQRSLDRASKLEEKREVSLKISKIQSIILFIGSPYRETATSGIFYYSVHLYNFIIFHFVYTISKGKYLNYIQDDGLLSYLLNPTREKKIIWNRINELIKSLVDSNINFTRIMFKYQAKQSRRFNPELATYYHLGMKGDQSRRRRSISGIGSTTCPRKISREWSISALTSQLGHLNNLKSNIDRIWPPNRVSYWANYIRRTWIKHFILGYVAIWFTCLFCIIISLHFAHLSLTKSSYDKNYAKFTLLDRLWAVDMLVYSSYGVSLFTGPLTIAIVGVYDQMMFVNSFERRFCHIRSKIFKLQHLCDRFKFLNKNGKLLNEDEGEIHKDSYNEQRIQDLMIKCDNAAIEFYISYRLFRDDLTNTLKFTQDALSLNASLVVTILLNTSFFYDRIPKDQIPVLSCGAIALLVTINGVFVPCARLHASCCRITTYILSLVSLVEHYNLSNYNSQDEPIVMRNGLAENSITNSSISNINKPQILMDYPKGDNDNNYSDYAHDEYSTFNFEYYSHSFISPHTTFLLRKIASNHAYMAKKCVVRLYGIVAIDHRGILKINFWLISSVVLVLTYFG